MKKLISTLNIPKAEWLKFRKTGITGTDAGAITGFNLYVSALQVYQDKISSDISDNDNEAMRQGRDLEEYVAQRFMEETGLKVRRANFIYKNEDYPFMLADFDRIIVGEKAGLECKTVSPYSLDRWENGEIPPHYQMQVQHYLAVSGFDHWYIAALIFGKEFIIRKIERDEELINCLIAIEERFWNENVLKRVMPDPDGTDSYSEQIAKIYSKGDKSKTIQLNDCGEMLKRRNDVLKLISKLENEKNEIEQRIKLKMGDASYGFADGYKVSWSSFEQKRLDSKLLKEEKPEIYDEYCKTSSLRRFIISQTA